MAAGAALYGGEGVDMGEMIIWDVLAWREHKHGFTAMKKVQIMRNGIWGIVSAVEWLDERRMAGLLGKVWNDFMESRVVL